METNHQTDGMGMPDDSKRRIGELHRSLRNPHSQIAEFAKLGFEDWTRSFPKEDTDALVDHNAGVPVRWTPGVGWRRTSGE
jgi:hypothetical protein